MHEFNAKRLDELESHILKIQKDLDFSDMEFVVVIAGLDLRNQIAYPKIYKQIIKIVEKAIKYFSPDGEKNA